MGMSEEYEPADRELSAIELGQVESIAPDRLLEIDTALLGNCSERWRKVAYVVGTTMSSPSVTSLSLPDIFYAHRLRQLVSSGELESQGDLSRMRYSEVRRALSSRGKI